MSRCNRRLFSTSSDESSHESPPVKKKKKTSEAEKVDWDAVRGKLEELLQPDNRFNTFDANVVDDIRRETKDEIPLMLHTVDDFAATLLLLPVRRAGTLATQLFLQGLHLVPQLLQLLIHFAMGRHYVYLWKTKVICGEGFHRGCEDFRANVDVQEYSLQ